MARFGPDASMAPDSGREFRLVSRWLLALGLRLLRALRRHRCACRPQLRGPLRRLQRRLRLDWATPTRRPLALTPASAACVVRRLSCKNHFTTETQRHREKPIYKLRGGKLRFSSSSSRSANATAPDRFCGPRLLGDGTPAKGSSTKGSSIDSEGSRRLSRLRTKRKTNHKTTAPIASCHQTPIRCLPLSLRVSVVGFQENSDSTNSFASNGSRSPAFSPTPTYRTGSPNSRVIATTTPPLAVPSSLVSTLPVTPDDCVNCRACCNPFCPVVASITSKVSCGAPGTMRCAVRFIFSSSSIRFCLVCKRPAVSTIT